MLTAILAIAFSMRGGRIATMRWLQKLLIVSPLFPFIAIQVGWITAEVGRQHGSCIRRRRVPMA